MSASGPAADGDLVTQLQAQTNRLASLMFNFVGSLQRDAPASSVRGEPVEFGSTLDVGQQTQLMAEQLIQAFKPVEELVAQLPDPGPGEDAELGALAVLQAEHDALGEQLQAVLAGAQRTLAESQDLYAALADAKLQARARQLAPPP